MSFFSQYSGAAGGVANSYGIPQPIFFGLIQQESGWNPTIVGDNGAAYGFGQLHAGAANDMGVNRFDPMQNLQGTAAYLSKQYQKYGNWTDALAGYNQGHAGNSAGLSYAQSVLNKAKSMFGGGSDITNAATCASGDPISCASIAGSALGISGGDSNGCGTFDFVCKLKAWISQSEFFTRLGLAALALILILGALYLLKERS